MGAGASAAAERDRSLAQARLYEEAARAERRRAEGFEVAAATEPQVAEALEALRPCGYVILHDRHWPGTKRSNIDHLAIGPGGVLVVDTKAWAGTVRVEAGHLLQDGELRDDAADASLRQALAVEDELAAVGLAPLEVVPVLCFLRQEHVVERIGRVRLMSVPALQRFAATRDRRLEEDDVHRIARRLENACPPAGRLRLPAPPITPPAVVPRAVGDAGDHGGLFTDRGLALAALAAAQRQPIERWMTFLHPEQLDVVRRSWNGPCRIRGAAGTGKTVVGLHRAAYLAAAHPGRILFTTYVKTLPLVLRQLYARLARDTVDRLEFSGLHAWAKRLLDARGIRVEGDRFTSPRLFDRAYTHWVGRHELVSRETPREYWREEIDAVIKGRGLTTFEQYADLRRVGRRTRLTTDNRALVWDLYVAYEQALRRAGVCDANDLLALALRCVEEIPPQPGYRAVIADEVQDLNLLGVRLLHALVGDAPDGLTLIGDGQQAVYPGGYTLAEAGVSVTGRAVVLRVNYRNTQPVIDYASALVADDDFEDLTTEAERGHRDLEVLRAGVEPIEVHPATEAEHDRLLVEAVRAARTDGARPGDMAVLTATNQLARHYRDVLSEAGVAVLPLERYDGTASDAVKVGTIKRAKGLEFSHVFLARVPLDALRGPRELTDSGEAERRARERREYFVGMTRARDLLWVGHVAGTGHGKAPGASLATSDDRRPERRASGSETSTRTPPTG